MKNFLITGGDGFIGAAICSLLSKSGHKVTSLDNHSRKKHLIDTSDYKSIKCDITNTLSLSSIKGNFDSIIHLAFINGTRFFYEKPDEVIRVGIMGTMNILNFAKKKKIKNFYLASSSEVYQTPIKIPTDEKEIMKVPDAYNPRYSYGASKIMTEMMAIHIGKEFLNKMVIFRPHNVYGANMGYEHVIPELINKITNAVKKKKKFIKIKGTGKETRSFNYIDDFTSGLNLLIKNNLKFETFNIGNNDEITINTLVKKIMKIMGVRLDIKYSDLAIGSTNSRCPDIKKITKLGYKQNYSLEKGLEETISWYLNS